MKLLDHLPTPQSDGKRYLRIKVSPRQPRTEFFGVLADGTLKIRLAAIPEKGKANEELVGFLSEELGVHRSKIMILSGAGEALKLVRVG